MAFAQAHTTWGTLYEVDTDRAQALAEELHRGERDPAGAPLIDHVRRVAAAVPSDARVVAWLHEVLEYTSTSEHALLGEGISRRARDLGRAGPGVLDFVQK